MFTKFGIKRHNQLCHSKRVEEFKCNECGMLANTASKIENHMKKEHNDWHEKSQEICYHYRNGFCFRGDKCRFAHVGYQKKNASGPTSKTSTDRNWTPACTKGEGCSWLARGACKFFHRGVGVQKANNTQLRTNQTTSSRTGRQHLPRNSMSDFPPIRRGNQQERRNGGRN